MENKTGLKAIIVPVMIGMIFVLSIIGFREEMGHEFSLAAAFYATLTFFTLDNMKPEEVLSNKYLFIAKYLAAFLLGFGIYNLVYVYVNKQWRNFIIRLKYRNHVVVFSTKMVGHEFINDLLANHYKVIVVEKINDDPFLTKLKKKGVIVVEDDEIGADLLDSLMVSHAGNCILASSEDDRNIDLSLKLIKHLTEAGHRKNVRILTHINDRDNIEVIRDYMDTGNSDHNFSLEVFNVASTAAKKIYDHFPPHEFFQFKDRVEENAIAVVGFNDAAEDFILENLILSHYADGENIKIYLVDADADAIIHRLSYQYPYHREFIDIIPVKLLNNKFFANFNWSKELIEKLSKVKAAYFFGDKGSELINLTWRFRQFVSGQTLNYVQTPIMVCFPEDTVILKLHDSETTNKDQEMSLINGKFNIHYINLITDTCTSARLIEHSEYIDMLSRVINYYYSIKYEFSSLLKEHWGITDTDKLINAVEMLLLDKAEDGAELTEQEVELLVLTRIAEGTKLNLTALTPQLSIGSRWHALTYHKKSSNRYAARHFAVKISIMKNLGCFPLTKSGILESFSVIAPVEHKRWCAEKMVHNYRFGVLPKDRAAKNDAKEILKIHDQLIPYQKLTQVEKEKDLNIFLLMPMLSLLKTGLKK